MTSFPWAASPWPSAPCATVVVLAVGSAPLTYQWYQATRGVEIIGKRDPGGAQRNASGAGRARALRLDPAPLPPRGDCAIHSAAIAKPLRNGVTTEGYIVSDYAWSGSYDDEDVFIIGPLFGSVGMDIILTDLPAAQNVQLSDYGGNVVAESHNYGTTGESIGYRFTSNTSLAFYVYITVYGCNHAGVLERPYRLAASWN